MLSVKEFKADRYHLNKITAIMRNLKADFSGENCWHVIGSTVWENPEVKVDVISKMDIACC